MTEASLLIDDLDSDTKRLFDSVIECPRHGPAIREINRLCEASKSVIESNTDRPAPVQVAVVPGFLYREYPGSGSDGRMLIDACQQLGWECHVIDVGSTGRLCENAEIITAWLNAHAQRPTVLASISKGGSDIVAALQQGSAARAFRHVVGWVDVCGIIRGSPVVDIVSRQRWAMLGFRALFALRRWCFSSVLDLSHADGALARGFCPPPHMNIVHVTGFPQREDFVNPRLRKFHQQMSALGPNDGAILLRDVLDVAGVVYPVWGSDHYMRPRFRAQRLCLGLLQYAAKPPLTKESV